MNLYPYQQTGAEFLAARKAALLADEMGLGKSAQAIAACDELMARDVVVVCPASVRENWRREFKKFSWTGIEPSVLSYDTARILGGGSPHLPCDVLILDEAHYLKSTDAKRTQAILGESGLIHQAEIVFLLTGTPMPNNPSELWPALHALFPEAIMSTSGKPYSFWQFAKKYCVVKNNGFGMQIVRGKNLDQLKEKMAPFMLRRLKEEVMPDLPDIRWSELFVEAGVAFHEPTSELALVRQALQNEGVDGLRKIAHHVATLRRLTGLAKVAPVIEWVKDWLDAGGGKIVLFAHHREVLHELAHKIEGGVLLTGSTTDRQSMVDRFQNDPDCRVFIGQIQAAGTGITLTAASDVLFVESSWVPAENQQAAMRIHRIGQRNACLVRVATLAGSIDEDIAKACVRKMNDIRQLFG
jgi:SWI/SNF-related matrix-associated actin-dependent regulator 1 of chromatin subfamily A